MKGSREVAPGLWGASTSAELSESHLIIRWESWLTGITLGQAQHTQQASSWGQSHIVEPANAYLMLNTVGRVQFGITFLEEKMIIISQSLQRVHILKPSVSFLGMHLLGIFMFTWLPLIPAKIWTMQIFNNERLIK